jgi:RNA polymerase sigma-70 factor (ECF subfamily)
MTEAPKNVGKLVDHLFRHQYGKMVAVLSAKFGFRNLQVAEDLVTETLMAAFQTWPHRGIPEVPEAWLMQVAKNKALNLIKHEKRKGQAHQRILEESPALLEDNPEATFEREIADSQLRMIFACCHPNIPAADQLTLVLKILCGFGVDEVARALLIGKDAAEKRLARAKAAIREHGIELEAPGGDALLERKGRVLHSLYLVFNEGYSATSGDVPIQRDLCDEALRLLAIFLETFAEDREALALMALMHFHAARFDARMDHDGAVVILQNQDRNLWDQTRIRLGLHHLMASARGDEVSAFHLEASIAAQHCMAPTFADTNWAFVGELYQRLHQLTGNPIHRLNLAIVKSEVQGPKAAVAELEELKKERKLKRYPLFFATLGELYRRVGDSAKAAENFNLAIRHATSESERDFFNHKIESLAKIPNA